eukprot:symbB.v1.2.023616.t1/scaffold2174.1/size86949/3
MKSYPYPLCQNVRKLTIALLAVALRHRFFSLVSLALDCPERRRDDTKLVDGRTHSPRFADQLGSHSRTLRSYQPWARQAAGVSYSFERYRCGVRPACFAK